MRKHSIPLNNRLTLEDADRHLNENGIPCCPKDPNFSMKHESSKSYLRCGLPTMKFVCPKMKWQYNKDTKKSKRVTSCQDPCTTSASGRMFYVYPQKNLRQYPGVLRGFDEWSQTYKIRGTVEKTTGRFKDSFGISGRKSRCEKTLHADLLLAGIKQLIIVVVADSIHQQN